MRTETIDNQSITCKVSHLDGILWSIDQCTDASPEHCTVRYYKHKEMWEGKTSWPVLLKIQLSQLILIGGQPHLLQLKVDLIEFPT